MSSACFYCDFRFFFSVNEGLSLIADTTGAELSDTQ